MEASDWKTSQQLFFSFLAGWRALRATAAAEHSVVRVVFAIFMGHFSRKTTSQILESIFSRELNSFTPSPLSMSRDNEPN